jgi:hypothetical protein
MLGDIYKPIIPPVKGFLIRIDCEHVSKLYFKFVIMGNAPKKANSKAYLLGRVMLQKSENFIQIIIVTF